MSRSKHTRLCLASLMLLIVSWLDAQAANLRATEWNVDTAVPVLSIRTSAPPEISLGKPANYTVSVKNTGDEDADVVVVQVALPTDAPLVDSSPSPTSVDNSIARFDLGRIGARQQRKIHLQFKPERLGTIRLKARTSFATQSQTEIQVREARLAIDCSAPLKIGYGEEVQYQITVSNVGGGIADGVVITPRLPREAYEKANSGNPVPIGELGPGQSKVFRYTANAIADGTLRAVFTVHDRLEHMAKTESRVKVVRPALNVRMDGPGLRFFGRDAEYTVQVANPGDASLYDVTVVMTAPRGLKILGTSREAMYSKSRNTLSWQLDEVPAGGEATWSFDARATREGRQVPRVAATSDSGLAAEDEFATRVVSQSQLYATVINESGPREIGEVVDITVVVTNRGTRSADGVTVVVDLPDGLYAKPMSGVSISGSELRFDRLSLKVGEHRELKIQAVGYSEGDHVVRVTYGDESHRSPLTVEGRVTYYADPNSTRVARLRKHDPQGPRLLRVSTDTSTIPGLRR